MLRNTNPHQGAEREEQTRKHVGKVKENPAVIPQDSVVRDALGLGSF